MTRKKIENFHLRVILSVYHNRKLCRFAEMQDFLSYVVGVPVYIREVPRARAIVAQYLDKQMPFLRATTIPPLKHDQNQSMGIVREIAKKVGTFELPVAPMRKGVYRPVLSALEGLA